MVLQLVLHAAPDVLRDGVAADGVTGGAELVVHKGVLILFIVLFALVCASHDGGQHAPANGHLSKEPPRAEERQEDGVVGGDGQALAPQLLLQAHADRVEAPDEQRGCIGEQEVEVLVLAPPAVVLRAGRPQPHGRVDHDVLVHADHVGGGMVLVVLVAPPLGAQARADAAEVAHERAPLPAAVHVVVREEAARHLADREQRQPRQPVQVQSERAGGEHAQPGQQHLGLLQRVALPPALAHQPGPELAEGQRVGVGLGGRLVLDCGELLEHLHGLI
mmetsp:Transcript_12893/g.21830  ORF Transcript_12893/g.21830 Transcript_12893/m.21830 type:complete len:276 (+) Transcript_12893:513-1340(+)